MHPKTDKRRLYELMERFLDGKMDEPNFCDEFYYSYDLSLDYDTLTNEENHAFKELSNITSRFSEFEEEHKELPDFFYTKEELQQQIIETKNVLHEYFDKLEKSGELDCAEDENDLLPWQTD